MTPAALIATVGGIGHMRPAPGTWGSLAGLILAYGVIWAGGFIGLIALTLIATAAGWWATGEYLKASDTDDPSEVVIDEVAGQCLGLLIVAAFVPTLTLDLFVAAFVLFRLFDILKIWPANWAEQKLPGTTGVMVDDLIAGVYAGAIVVLIGLLL